MIGLDTHVLVRYIAQDDASQSRKATVIIEQECTETNPGFVSLIVLVELVWVAESCYAAKRNDVSGIVRRILNSRQLMVQDTQCVWQALTAFDQSNVDFADCLVARLAETSGCTKCVTFDKKAVKVGMSLLG